MSGDPSDLDWPALLEAGDVVVLALRQLRRKPTDRFADADLMAAKKVLGGVLKEGSKGRDAIRSLGKYESRTFDALWRLVETTNPKIAKDAVSDLRYVRSKIAPGPSKVDPKLTRPAMETLEAAYRLGAFDEGSSRTKPEIMKIRDPAKGAGSGATNELFGGLVDGGFFASRRGGAGGYWLTERGRFAVEARKGQNRGKKGAK